MREIQDFGEYLEEHGLGEYEEDLEPYENLIEERMQEHPNAKPESTLAGALYDAKIGEMTQVEVASELDVSEVTLRRARKEMGLPDWDVIDY